MTSDTINEDGLLKASPSTIFTYSGRTIDPLNPDPSDIYIEDIAHALSNQCRWTGHTQRFYSVAEHCVLVSRLLEEETPHLALFGLLHDASEAYLADLARPIKKAPGLGEVYLQCEATLEDAISDAFSLLQTGLDPLTKWADDQLLRREAERLVPGLGPHMPPAEKYCPELFCWSPEEAEREFLLTFSRLSGLTVDVPSAAELMVNKVEAARAKFFGPKEPEKLSLIGQVWPTVEEVPAVEVLPTASQARKDIPLTTGVLDYFPAALAAVAAVSKAGNDKHNPGQPLHWARAKSMDQADCIGRHLLERGGIDPETGQRHTAQLAWRALALLQLELEEAGEAPQARGAKS